MGYIGPNGAGKTTSMKILVGLINDYTGEVRFMSEELRSTDRYKSKIGYLPQETGFQEWRTVEHALMTFGLLSGLKSQVLKSKIPQILNLVGLPDSATQKIVTLSGGMQQKLKLAQALIHDPELIVLDEPMNGLDPASRFHMKQVIKQIADEGRTVIFSSHILNDVQDIADSIAILNQGLILKVGSPKELQQQFQIGNDIEVVYAPDENSMNKSKNLLTSLDGIAKIDQSGPNRQIFHLSPHVDLDQTMHSLLSLLVANKIKIRKMQLLEPSLEEVYIKYVGGIIQ